MAQLNLRALLPITVLALSVLAGCIGGDDGTPSETSGTPSPTASGSAGPTPTGTSGTSGPDNQAPEAALTAKQGNADLTITGGSVNVQPDVDVVFDGSTSTDPDGDALAYAWKVDGAADAATTASLTKKFAAGDHDVALTVSDGTLEDTLTLRVVAGSAGGVTNDAAIAYEFKGTFDAKVGAADPQVKATEHAFAVPANAKQITLWLNWKDASGTNAPEADLDLFLNDPANKEQAAAETSDFEYIRFADAAKITAGNWKALVFPYLAPKTAYTLSVLVWTTAPKNATFTGTDQGAATLGQSAVPDNHKHSFTPPAGTGTVAARLTWAIPTVPNSNFANPCTRTGRTLVDYDLYVTKGTTSIFTSGAGSACEFGFIDAKAGETLKDAGSAWTFAVDPYLAPSATYTLLIEYA